MQPGWPGWLGVFARGLLIGAADLVPGVSGGTIAFITGIYERLITALKVGSSPYAWLILLRGNPKAFWKAIDGSFMAVLLLGVVVAVFSLASALHELLIGQTVATLAFFCGLTLAAAISIGAGLRPSAKTVAAGALGLALALALVAGNPVALSQAPPLQGFFAAGMLALCAMILPGISGSFLLLLIGVYPFLLEALHLRDLPALAVFAAGGICGLALFARLLRLLLARHHDATIALLVGLMLGALPKLWPWKQPAEGVKIILQPSVLPSSLAEPGYLGAAVALVLGVAAVVATELAARTLRQRQG